MKIYIATFLICILYSFNTNAFDLRNFVSKVKDNSAQAWNEGQTDIYLPFLTWHNRLFYDKEHYDQYNETPIGMGVGKSIWNGNENYGLYIMAFSDSNYHLETFGGYVHTYNWSINNSENWKAGLGYTLALTQREDYSYIPLPIILPVMSVSYKEVALQAAYVPGVKNNGNVLFAWLKYSF